MPPKESSKKSSQKTAITPTRQDNFAEWYQQIIKAADLAEHSPSRGSMVIKPWGYGIWECIQRHLDDLFKASGHENAYFPLLIPIRLLEKEASHIQGFAQECAVVTHSRLASTEQGKLIPSSPLEEPYVVRPTSEAIIGETYAKWVESYRDLPILINQWANVVRWEMRTRFFVRTTEFLWQEGHTVHATAKEAKQETIDMLKLYTQFVTKELAMPVIAGTKTSDERFPGAEETYCIEALMQDGKALQAGTSHFLGQIFAKAYNIRFQNAAGEQEYAWTTSWGVSTRLIGGMIMTHSDDNGLVLPPNIAPKHIIIQPILREQPEDENILAYCEELSKELTHLPYAHSTLRVKIDKRPLRPGEKNWQNIKRGAPIRIEIGTQELHSKNVSFSLRHDPKNNTTTTKDEFLASVTQKLSELQAHLLTRAQKHLHSNISCFHTLKETETFFAGGGLGFVYLPWCEKAIGHEFLAKHKISPRCIPLSAEEVLGLSHDPAAPCAFSGNKATHSVLFAKAY